MTIAAWATWNDAALSSDLPLAATVRGFRDTRLPFSSRFSGSVSIDHEFSLTGSMTGMVGASVGYGGDRLGPLQGPGMSQPGADRPRQDFSDYTKLDLRAGIRQGEWTTNLFVTNVNNSRGAVDGGPGGGFPTSLNYIQPRAYGLSIARTF